MSVKSLVFRTVTAVMSYTPRNTAPTSEAEIAGKTSRNGKTNLLDFNTRLSILLSSGPQK